MLIEDIWKFHRILMVSRFWVCKVDGYLITALWQPMNDDGLLINPTYEFIDCVEKLRPWAGFHDILERLLPQLVGRTNLAFPNLDDPIHTIFKVAIAQQYGQQLSRHREFRDPLKSDEERRDLISNEIECFRVIMDIIHELSLIINIIEEQQDFTFAQAKRLNFSFGTLSEVGSFREQVVSSMSRFKALRDRAGIAKSSTESLLDIKMKQENLEQATNIRKLTGNISSLVAEADQRARESERAQTMLFVFTIVTVIFTPLSFVAAFFAIPSREFPQIGEGISWSKAQIGWGLADIAGTSTGISEQYVLMDLMAALAGRT
ncbi:unnamed protein product [Clonostachys solani]|uniref:Uncharacterized protein n=1 Tax=Clonostachys solani TaxID=160281 RepID=A0A9N9ZI43_9HYPO|nr:unnamed protein product [Clonostachys solani]